MAVRRMFSKNVINSGRFLRMPPSSRLLYYDLGMAADDDGVVEAFSVIRSTGATEDDLRVLAARKFITVLNDDLVSYINEWHENNYIRPDRYTPSIHANLLVQITGETSTSNQRYTAGIPDDNQTHPQDRVGEDRSSQDRSAADICRYSAAAKKDPIEYAKAHINGFTAQNETDIRCFKLMGIDAEAICFAIDEACALGKRDGWGYAHQILTRFVRDGVKTLEDCKTDSKAFDAQKNDKTTEVKWVV